jgi:hypothetical protein
MDASNKQETVAEKFARVWEKKNSKAARAGGVSLMALSLAACGSSSDTTTTTTGSESSGSTDSTDSTTTPTGQTYNLTDEVNDIAGGAGNDTIQGGVNSMGGSDYIVGGAGTDTLTVRMDANDAFGVIDGVENIVIYARGDNNAAPVSMVDVSGATTVTLMNGNSDFYINDFDNAVGLKLENSNDMYTISYADLSGDADGQAIEVDGYEGNLDIGTTGLESVTITASGEDSTVDFEDHATATITTATIKGAGVVDFDVNAESDALATITATDSTGANTYTVDNVTIDLTITGGSGGETAAFGTTLNSSDNIDLNGGEDTVSATVGAATTIRPTMSDVEVLDLGFTQAGTFDARNVTGATSLELSDIQAAVTVSRLDASVAALSVTEATATADAIGVTYATGADAAHSLTIGASNDDGDAVASLGAITISGNAGALTVTSAGDAANDIDGLTADDATSLALTATKGLAMGAGDISVDAATSVSITSAADTSFDDISAAAATSVTLTSAGGSLTMDDSTDLGEVLTYTISAADDDVTVDDQTLASATAINIGATGGAADAGVLVSDADVAVTLTASGADANDVTVAQIDVDHLTTLTATATTGADITVTDLVILGYDSSTDKNDVDVNVTLDATGVDADDNGSAASLTIADLDGNADGENVALDLVTLISDADGAVTFEVTTTTDTDAAVTEVDATGSAGTTTIDFNNTTMAATEVSTGAGGSTTTLTASVDTFMGGDGDDTITGGGGADDITTGGGNDIIVLTTTDTDVVQDFTAVDSDGDAVDIIHISVGAIDVEDGDGTALGVGAVTVQSQATTAVTAIAAATDLFIFTDAVANAAAMVTALEALTIADGSSIADNDDLLIGWTDGSDTYLSSVNIAITDPGGADINIDDAGSTNTTLVQLIGVDIADVVAGNVAIIA